MDYTLWVVVEGTMYLIDYEGDEERIPDFISEKYGNCEYGHLFELIDERK